MSSGRKIVTKIDSFPFLRGPTRFRKFRHTSESLKRHWISVPTSFPFGVFDPKTKTNFEGETLYRAPTSVKISDSRIFLGVSSEHIMWSISDLSLIQAEWFSSRDVCLFPLVRELFNPAEFGSRFSSGAKRSSFASTKNDNYFVIYQWLLICDRHLLYKSGSCLFKITSVSNDILLVVVKSWSLSSEVVEWRFLFFDAGLALFVDIAFLLYHVSVLLLKFSKSLVAVRINSKKN